MKYSLLVSVFIFCVSFFGINTIHAATGTTVCTMEYAPMCGKLPPTACPEGTLCQPPIPSTYGNTCMMKAAGATLINQGACTDIVGDDLDEHGCRASAGYSYDPMMDSCIRPWEKSENLVTWAYDSKLTQYASVYAFGFDRTLSRQEAAALLVRAGEKLFGLRYASYPDNCNIRYTDESLFDLTLKDTVYSACAFDMMHGSNGKFSPLITLTRAEALAIIMRALDGGKKEEPKTDMWFVPYADRAHELGIFSFANFKGFNEAITRGELIEWLYNANIYQSGKSLAQNESVIGSWTLVKFNSMNFASQSGSGDRLYTLTFDGNKVNTQLCNSIFGSYNVSGNIISAPAIASTMMYCEGTSMTLENAFQLDKATYTLTALSGSTSGTIELTLTTAKGDIFKYVR